MKKVFVDTAAWLALINSKDDFHNMARQVRQRLHKDGYHFITSDFVFLEVADALTSPLVRQKTISFINRVKELPYCAIRLGSSWVAPQESS